MPRIANPGLTQEVADRLAAYYANDPLTITVRSLPRQGLFIAVTHNDSPDGGLLFHVDQVRNGASGFRDEALAKINAYRDGVAYVPRPTTARVYDDIMTYSSAEALHVVE